MLLNDRDGFNFAEKSSTTNIAKLKPLRIFALLQYSEGYSWQQTNKQTGQNQYAPDHLIQRHKNSTLMTSIYIVKLPPCEHSYLYFCEISLEKNNNRFTLINIHAHIIPYDVYGVHVAVRIMQFTGMEISGSPCFRGDQILEQANGFTNKVAHLSNYLDQVNQSENKFLRVIQNHQKRREFFNTLIKLKWNMNHNE